MDNQAAVGDVALDDGATGGVHGFAFLQDESRQLHSGWETAPDEPGRTLTRYAEEPAVPSAHAVLASWAAADGAARP